ncbi:hypothetical protein FG386_002841 [Cryptosporidium ryanae]|uniref:uncharacterized protein n=1 Tax=Cryptosporidium ryanae TaxID=515981 RepID=UPI003519FF87|nr:hypothetical protein FG386_002841 [Cryptosporidium ryanae]
MKLSEKVEKLEKRIQDQNDAIETIATYMVRIMEENDELWKYIMRLKIKGKETPFYKLENNNQKFRSRTPPPLQEPKTTPKEQVYCNRRISDYKNDNLNTIIKLFKEWRDGDAADKFSNKVFMNELEYKYIERCIHNKQI